MATKKTQLLNILLIKSTLKRPQEVLKGLDKLETREIKLGGTKIGALYFRRSTTRSPSWLSFFEDALDVKALGIKVTSAAAILLSKTSGRWFAVAFGQGRHLLKPGTVEEDFGLRSTLNSVNPDLVRGIERKRFDPISRLAREQAARDAPIFEFGLELEQDMLRSLTGVPSDSGLGKRVSGRDSLTVAVPLNLGELNSQLDLYLKQWKSKAYQNRFPGVDNIKEVRLQGERQKLDDTLVAKLRAKDFRRLWLAVPEVIDWADVKGFRFGQAKKAALEADIHLADYVTSVRDLESLTVKRLRQNRVVGISASTDLATYEWPVYKCLYAELDTSSGSYVLDNGKWYKVDTDIVRDVERELKGISVSGLKLPRYKLGEGEPGYNKHAVSTKPNAYALMDRKLIPFGGGRSKIEFCDIYVKGNAMIHVKRYGGSNTLSYLFNQGVVAASLFLWDSRFRKELNQRLPTSHQLTNPAVRPKAESFEVAFGIISQSRSKLVLPFFSRVALRNAYRTLSSFGYRVTCTKIDFE